MYLVTSDLDSFNIDELRAINSGQQPSSAGDNSKLNPLRDQEYRKGKRNFEEDD
jgi:hypothetical protein